MCNVKKFSRKVTSGRITKEKTFMPLMLFYGEILIYFPLTFRTGPLLAWKIIISLFFLIFHLRSNPYNTLILSISLSLSLSLSLSVCVCVCVTGYRLGPWKSYRLETGIIRTSMAWRGAIGEIFFENWTVAEL